MGGREPGGGHLARHRPGLGRTTITPDALAGTAGDPLGPRSQQLCVLLLRHPGVPEGSLPGEPPWQRQQAQGIPSPDICYQKPYKCTLVLAKFHVLCFLGRSPFTHRSYTAASVIFFCACVCVFTFSVLLLIEIRDVPLARHQKPALQAQCAKRPSQRRSTKMQSQFCQCEVLRVHTKRWRGDGF